MPVVSLRLRGGSLELFGSGCFVPVLEPGSVYKSPSAGTTYWLKDYLMKNDDDDACYIGRNEEDHLVVDRGLEEEEKDS